MTPDDIEFADRLDRFLDALAAGTDRSPNGPPPDHELAETVRRLRAHDDAMPADLHFTDHLLEDLMRTATVVVSPPFQQSWAGTTGRNDRLAIRAIPRREDVRPRWVLTQFATAALVVLVLVGSIFAFGPGRPGRSDDAPAMVPAVSGPPATPAGEGPTVETLLATTLPVEDLPTAATSAFLIWNATIVPETEVAIPPDPIACCPGPQIVHVLAGELVLRVEGPVQVLRTGPEGSIVPSEEVAPGTEVQLQAGDSAVYSFELPATYHNAGTESVQLVAGGVFAGSPPGPPAGYAITNVKERYPAPKLPPGPLTATLQQATLAPEGIFPAPPVGSIQVVMTESELGSLGERSNGSSKNLGQEPAVVYALVLSPTGAAAGTPTTRSP